MIRLCRKCPLRAMKFSIRNLSNERNSRESSIKKRVREELARDKQTLQWRKTNEESGYVTTKFKYFANDEQTSDYIIAMQKPFKLTLKEWMDSWTKKIEKKDRHMQQYVPDRHEILGPDLATAHFLLHRGGAVKFVDSQNWMRADENGEFVLPTTYHPQFKVEALKCDNMKLYYEGLENIQWLQELTYLSFHNVKTFDDWCLDRVSGSQCFKLAILDISGTSCTARGLSCIYRLNNLRQLIVDNPKATLEFELSCSMLQEALPNLEITSSNTHEHK